MGSTRRKFTPEYKAEAVQFVISSGQPIAEVARNLGIVEGTLGNWVAKARENGEVSEPELSISERAELQRLRKELQQVKMERDFLKKRRPSSRARVSKVRVRRADARRRHSLPRSCAACWRCRRRVSTSGAAGRRRSARLTTPGSPSGSRRSTRPMA